MKSRPALPNNHLTVDDFFIWAGHAMRFEHLRYPFTRSSLLPADRRDAELMYLARLWRRGEMVTDHTYAHSGPCGRFAIDGKRCGGDI